VARNSSASSVPWGKRKHESIYYNISRARRKSDWALSIQNYVGGVLTLGRNYRSIPISGRARQLLYSTKSEGRRAMGSPNPEIRDFPALLHSIYYRPILLHKDLRNRIGLRLLDVNQSNKEAGRADPINKGR
jgi:hypothetical protein